uniref:Uncharacterized protein n=1 Tax=Sphaerodactylus townsendi TaxID=933632 RepID=A0ACB8FZM6_9SAUR
MPGWDMRRRWRMWCLGPGAGSNWTATEWEGEGCLSQGLAASSHKLGFIPGWLWLTAEPTGPREGPVQVAGGKAVLGGRGGLPLQPHLVRGLTGPHMPHRKQAGVGDPHNDQSCYRLLRGVCVFLTCWYLYFLKSAIILSFADVTL